MARISSWVGAVSFAASLALTATVAQADALRAHTTAPGAAPNTMTKLFAKYAEDAGIDVQVIEGQKLAKSMLLLGQGKIELMPTIVGQYARLITGTGPYKNLGDKGPEIAEGVRALVEFNAATQQFFTWESTGIKTLHDLKGKKVYVGPGGGGAGTDIEEIIELVTGMKPGDYESFKAPWGEGMGMMRNGQVDAMVRIAPVGAAVIQEFGLSKPIRFLQIEGDDLTKLDLYLKVPGRSISQIPAGTYEGQTNGDAVNTLSFVAGMGIHAGISDDVAYTLTKAFWDNIDEIKASASFLSTMDPAKPFSVLNVKLHPGALKYYDEAGIAVPDSLR